LFWDFIASSGIRAISGEHGCYRQVRTSTVCLLFAMESEAEERDGDSGNAEYAAKQHGY
jgi:hypothetical protein